MPKRVRRGKKRSKRGMLKKQTKLNSITIRNGLMPDSMFTKLKWHDPVQTGQVLYQGTVHHASKNYVINGLWKPDTSATAAINYIAAFAALYYYYRVHGCKITCSFANAQAANNTMVFMASGNAASSANSVANLTMLDAWDTKKCILSAQIGQNRCTLKKYVDFKKLVGSKSVKTDDNYAGSMNLTAVASDPTDLQYVLIGAQNLPSFTAELPFAGNLGVNYQIQFEWYVEFYDRRNTNSA
jgi:hypothetical protein